ncbi:hypothetical protein STCU_12388 [Strigomonas culicis]|uniref:Uncharacterized protein n=1 Tax=Strigomonas culicis TaxID=28005 RepID=S9TFA4_9TRYP|nr:hypothetical protein STCU_12388 [Strigomonas culicis]|eukprot:EPY15018.1 hypothetical protein STCU_12388 [Strigomonas culicis]
MHHHREGGIHALVGCPCVVAVQAERTDEAVGLCDVVGERDVVLANHLQQVEAADVEVLRRGLIDHATGRRCDA